MGDRITITIVLYNMLYILYNSTNTCDRQILSVWVYPTYSKVHSFWFMFVSLCLFLLSIHIKEHIITYFNSKPTHTHIYSAVCHLGMYCTLTIISLTTHSPPAKRAPTHTHSKIPPVHLNDAKSIWQQLTLCHFSFSDFYPCSHVLSHIALAQKNILSSFWLDTCNR